MIVELINGEPNIPEYMQEYVLGTEILPCHTKYRVRLAEDGYVKITSLQARLQLEEWGELETVEAIINTEDKIKVIWEYVSFLLIYSPMVRQIKDALGWDEDKLKQFFKEASEIII